MALKNTMTSERWTGKYLEGIGCGLIWNTLWPFFTKPHLQEPGP